METVVALFMITMGTLTFVSLTLLAKKLAYQAQTRQIALAFANKQMEELRATSFNLLPAGTSVNVTVPADVVASLPTTQNSAHPMNAKFIVTATSSPTIRQVTVVVNWKSHATFGGADKQAASQVRLTKLVAMQPPDPTLTN